MPSRRTTCCPPGSQRGRRVARLAPLGGERLGAGPEQQPGGVRQLLLYAALMERPRDALRMVRGILFPGREWLAVRYGLQGAGQVRCYRLVHPLRVARAFARGLRRPLARSSLE